MDRQNNQPNDRNEIQSEGRTSYQISKPYEISSHGIEKWEHIITEIKGGLTTLRMRGSIAMKNFSMLVFRITSVITLQEEEATTAPNQRATPTNRHNPNRGIPIETVRGEGRTYSRRATLGRFGSPGR